MGMPWERRGRGDSREGGYGGGRGFGGDRPRFRREESNEPKPVKEGEIHTVTISEVSRRGDGIARIKNFVVFVAGTQKGDTVKVKITEVRGNHATGEVVGEGEASETSETSDETTDEVVESSEGPKNNGEEEKGEEAAEESEEEDEEEEEFA